MSDLENIRAQILELKEKRWLKQKAFITHYKSPLISYTINTPSWPKTSSKIFVAFLRSFLDFVKELTATSKEFQVLSLEDSPLGPEAFIISKMGAQDLKELAICFEAHHHIGRFVDVDITDSNGKKVERKSKRKCFLCEEQAAICMRNQTHSPEEIKEYFDRKITEYLDIKKQQ